MWILLAILILAKHSLCDLIIPISPCPNVFNYRYKYDPKSEVMGVIEFPNDLSGRYRIELNMTVAAYVNRNIEIKRVTSPAQIQNGENLIYHIMFPQADAIPEVLSIVFNNNIQCLSFQEHEQSFGYTTLHAFDFFSTQITAFVTPGQTPNREGNFPQSEQFISKLPSNNLPITYITAKPGVSTKITSTTDYWISVMVMGTTPKTVTPVVPFKTTSASVVSNTEGSVSSIATPVLLNELVNRLKEEIGCGIAEDTQPLLVHGKPTTEGQYPWLTAMFHLNEETAEYKFKCAGSLVSPNHVITAAHCVRIEKNTVISKDNIILVLGKHNIHSWAVRSEIRDVKKIYIHPEYTHPSDADIAIVVMFKPVQYTSKIKPLCLWMEGNNTDSTVGSNGVVVGWGRDEYESTFVPEPRQLTMPIVSQEDCLRSDERFLKLTSHRTFCAGSRNGEGPCTGDSGGGFIMKRKGKWTLRGIVSSALVDSTTHSCDLNNYMVFADVTKYLPWITHILVK